MQVESQKNLLRAVFRTVAYADIFDHPLTAGEIHRYLIGAKISVEDLDRALGGQSFLTRTGRHFTLPGREEIIPIRMQREARSRALLPAAIRYGRILGRLPFVRMVALTGSLAVLNVSKADDFDYMLVTVPGRVWTARAFALLFNRFVRLSGHTICPNLIVSENALEWPLHDLYSARELCQMLPVAGRAVYRKLVRVNAWARDILPNAFDAPDGYPAHLTDDRRPGWSRLLETVLGGILGDRIETWEMTRKIARFSRQAGYGEETIFSADVCQGNFHHHRRWTREVYEKKLLSLDGLQECVSQPAHRPGIATGASTL